MSTDQIADALQISREEVSYYIYTVCGLTFNGWLSSRRLERCVQLLEESELNMSEIAYTTGYSHLAAMSKAFKTKYGCSPREYRKKHLVDLKIMAAGKVNEG
ncbi:MAG: helix-turn-helix transcriptional regulator [Prevotella sp.]|nr:helix-turn-helix transcriptional regulator [Prevotella sp.]